MNILETAPVDDDGWKKSASFESLSSTIQGKMYVQNTADLISAISKEILINVTIAIIVSTRVKEKIISSMNNIGNLTDLVLLHSNSKKAKNLASCDLKDRASDLACIRLSFNLDEKAVDTRVSQASTDFQYSLNLSQSIYDPSTGMIVPPSTPKDVTKRVDNQYIIKLD